MSFKLNDFRSQILLYLTLFVAAVFLVRLFTLQVVRGDYYREEALLSQQKKFAIPASRGQIYLKDGDQSVPLVLNEAVATVFADPSFIDEDEVPMIAAELNKLLKIDQDEIIATITRDETAYEVIAKNISADLGEQVKELALKGIGVQSSQTRVYPEGTTAAQVVGFVDNDGQGQYGLEQYLDEQLAGKEGQLKAITDVNGVPLPTSEENIQTNAEAGDDVTLTIDRSVQQFVEESLQQMVSDSGAKSGSAIVMDPNTGQVRAMANYPTFDPSKFAEQTDLALFQNEVVSGAYETGSGVKSFTMSMGLNEGIVNPNTVYYDSGQKQVDDRVITNADFSGGVDRTMTDVIQKSINTGVVHVLEAVGGGTINDQAQATLYEYFTDRFGFGQPTGIELAGEVSGTIISPEEQEGNAIRYANMSFGQGMTVTMLQMAAGYSALVNGGDYYQPTVVDSYQKADGSVAEVIPKVIRDGIITDKTSNQIREMMQTVVDNGGGLSAKRDGYTIGGKTGTAQIPDGFGGYAEGRFIGSFTGFGATEGVDYVIMTRINEPTIPGYAGSVAAAPLFADISNFLIDYHQLGPEG